jgi:hypothetical protein
MELFSCLDHRLYITFDGAVIGSLNLRGKIAGWKLSASLVISDAVAADILAAAGLIGAVASFFIDLFFALHIKPPN